MRSWVRPGNSRILASAPSLVVERWWQVSPLPDFHVHKLPKCWDVVPIISYNHDVFYISHRIHGAGIYANIWGILMVNVTIYGIHGSYGIYIYIYLSTYNWINWELHFQVESWWKDLPPAYLTGWPWIGSQFLVETHVSTPTHAKVYVNFGILGRVKHSCADQIKVHQLEHGQYKPKTFALIWTG